MARILVQGEWFEEIASTAIYETEFESVVTAYASTLYPEYFVVPFKITVYAEDGAAKADLALIEKNYKEWWVAEVEMGHHSLEAHVLPQIRILSKAAYGEEEARRLASKCPDLNVGRLLDMMKGSQPKVIVIVNTPRRAWIPILKKYDAILAVFEMFRSQKNEYIFRLNGEQPTCSPDLLSSCMFDPLLPRFLVVNAPAGLNIAPRSRVAIFYHGQITEWDRIDSSDKMWLSPVGPNPLSTEGRYDILRRANGDLIFQESSE